MRMWVSISNVNTIILRVLLDLYCENHTEHMYILSVIKKVVQIITTTLTNSKPYLKKFAFSEIVTVTLFKLCQSVFIER